jgi:hypothetical protein
VFVEVGVELKEPEERRYRGGVMQPGENVAGEGDGGRPRRERCEGVRGMSVKLSGSAR